MQVIVFRKRARGRNEGQPCVEHVPEGTMTNATVEATVEGTRGESWFLRTKAATNNLRAARLADLHLCLTGALDCSSQAPKYH